MYNFIRYSLLFILFKFNCIYGQDTLNKNYTVIKYPNGNICSEGYMINGKPDGFWKSYYVNGVIKSEGKRVNHLLDSTWIFFSEAGDTTEKISYLLGKKNGYYLKFKRTISLNSISKNNIVSNELYINDLKEGLSNYYFDDGTLNRTVYFKKNKKEGLSKEYDNTGKLVILYRYYNDYLISKTLVNQLNNNQPEGLWIEYFPEGGIKSEKYYKNGLLSGYYKEYDDLGKQTQNLLYIDGKLKDLEKADSINIEERIDYFDNSHIKSRSYFKDNKPIGIHREYDLNGKVINARVFNSDGILLSTGIINDDGTKEGNFTYFYSDGGIKSCGLYRNNLQQGKWLFYFKNRNFEQIGFFDRGLLDGNWKWFSTDSILLKSEYFIHSKRDGFYYELSKLGDTIAKGFYKDNFKDGLWFLKSGDTYSIGLFKNDLKEGIWKTFYNNGKLFYYGKYVNGLPEGKHYIYYDTGIIKEEQFYVMGLKENNWKKYNPDGSLFLTITYQNDTELKINGYKLEIVK